MKSCSGTGSSRLDVVRLWRCLATTQIQASYNTTMHRTQHLWKIFRNHSINSNSRYHMVRLKAYVSLYSRNQCTPERWIIKRFFTLCTTCFLFNNDRRNFLCIEEFAKTAVNLPTLGLQCTRIISSFLLGIFLATREALFWFHPWRFACPTHLRLRLVSAVSGHSSVAAPHLPYFQSDIASWQSRTKRLSADLHSSCLGGRRSRFADKNWNGCSDHHCWEFVGVTLLYRYCTVMKFLGKWF